MIRTLARLVRLRVCDNCGAIVAQSEWHTHTRFHKKISEASRNARLATAVYG